MTHATDQLDELNKSERRRSRRYFFIGVALVAAILLVHFMGSAGQMKQVEGITKGLYGRPDDRMGETMYLLVVLDDGRDVKVFLPSKTPFLKNTRVVATETTTWLFGFKRYSFLSYPEAMHRL
jgi:hypothetical protein